MAWLSGYGYRQKIPIKRVDGAVADYQMELNVHKGAGASSGDDCYLKDHALSWTGTVPNDIRFTKADGITELHYWIETSDANDAVVWVEFDSIGTTDTDFYIYYGKSGDATTSNGNDTFLFFDHFLGDAIDTNKWNTSGTVTVSDGAVHLNGDDAILGKTIFGAGYAIEARAKADEQDSAFAGLWAHITGVVDLIDLMNSDLATPDDFDNFQTETHKDSAYTRSHQDNWTDFRDTFYIYRIKRISSSKVIFEQEANTYTQEGGNIPTVDLYPHFRVWDSSQVSTLDVDWTFVRKYSDPEPTWGTWGSEEKLNINKLHTFRLDPKPRTRMSFHPNLKLG